MAGGRTGGNLPLGPPPLRQSCRSGYWGCPASCSQTVGATAVVQIFDLHTRANVFRARTVARAGDVNVAEREACLESLKPTTEKQKSALAAAAQADTAIGQTRTQLALALVDPISYTLLSVIVASATCLFCGFGSLSKRHPMAFVILAVGSLAI